MKATRSSFAAVLLALSLLSTHTIFAQVQRAESSPEKNIRVTLLGTGAGPVVNLKHYGPATLVQAGGETLLFDCGRGALIRLAQAGVPSDQVRQVFLTHLHSDHIVDIPDLFLTPWAGTTARKLPFEVWGPRGTRDMMDHIERAFAFDIHIRRDVDEKFSSEGIQLSSHDIEQGTVFEKNGVKVTAFLVDHGPVKPAFGYRVDFAGHSVIISGDTRPSENLVRYAKGADVLIHETLDLANLRSRAARLTEAQIQQIAHHHTTPEQAGALFSRVKPKLAVYSHYQGSPSVAIKTRQTYDGPLALGVDLMIIDIGDQVDVRLPSTIPD